MTTVNEEGKALVEQSTFDKSKALADFMEYIHTYLTDDECDQVLKAFELADKAQDRKSTRLNSSHSGESRMPSSA